MLEIVECYVNTEDGQVDIRDISNEELEDWTISIESEALTSFYKRMVVVKK